MLVEVVPSRHSKNAISHNGCCLQLSDECRDLLNRIFVTNEKSRITVAEIKDHPWFKMPLSEEYAKAEQKILELQQQHNDYTASRKISTVRPHPVSCCEKAS